MNRRGVLLGAIGMMSGPRMMRVTAGEGRSAWIPRPQSTLARLTPAERTAAVNEYLKAGFIDASQYRRLVNGEVGPEWP